MAAKIGVKGAATKVKTHIFGNDNNKYNKNTKIIDVANLALKHPTAANEAFKTHINNQKSIDDTENNNDIMNPEYTENNNDVMDPEYAGNNNDIMDPEYTGNNNDVMDPEYTFNNLTDDDDLLLDILVDKIRNKLIENTDMSLSDNTLKRINTMIKSYIKNKITYEELIIFVRKDESPLNEGLVDGGRKTRKTRKGRKGKKKTRKGKN